mmetsp:Transcript_99364/g.296925  ORF Transcript_99364/g.296925 Transcript_99364/m.296925 type:complete len:129 (+) Transcript_99364:395-781(+)
MPVKMSESFLRLGSLEAAPTIDDVGVVSVDAAVDSPEFEQDRYAASLTKLHSDRLCERVESAVLGVWRCAAGGVRNSRAPPLAGGARSGCTDSRQAACCGGSTSVVPAGLDSWDSDHACLLEGGVCGG